MNADDIEVAYLQEQIRQIERAFRIQAKPYVDRLVEIESSRMKPLILQYVDEEFRKHFLQKEEQDV